ncbi:MAG: hypothetical protein K6T16_00490 [Candidatus Pacearchaeota archaeon]|nr:hypothetical protein [Candidatus Pacearchaeota archaeon]
MNNIWKKIKLFGFAGLTAAVVSCSGGVPYEVQSEIEKKINVGMGRAGYGGYVTGAGGKVLSKTRVIQTLVIRNEKEGEYELEVDLTKNQIVNLRKR